MRSTDKGRNTESNRGFFSAVSTHRSLTQWQCEVLCRRAIISLLLPACRATPRRHPAGLRHGDGPPFLETLRDFRFGSVSHVGDLSRVWSLVCSLLQCQLVKQVLPCYSAVLCQIWFDSILLRSTCGHERTKLQRSDGFNLCSESVALSVGRPLVEVLLFSTKAYFNLSHRVTKVQ